LLAVRGSGDQLAGGAIQNVEEAIAIGLYDQVLVSCIEHHRDLRGVPVMLVVLGELEIPFQLAGIGIEGEQGIAVQVIARASGAAIRWRRISRGPVEQIGCGSVRARIPCRSATNFPRFSLPTIVPRFARTGNRVEAPLALAGRRIISVDESANAVFAAGYSQD